VLRCADQPLEGRGLDDCGAVSMGSISQHDEIVEARKAVTDTQSEQPIPGWQLCVVQHLRAYSFTHCKTFVIRTARFTARRTQPLCGAIIALAFAGQAAPGIV
jgi:hypothetical protein